MTTGWRSPRAAARRSWRPDTRCSRGSAGDWPPLLGVNEVELKDGARVLARLPEDQGGHPLLVLGEHGKGRTAVWTSDIGPHWLSPEFCAWEGYGRLWSNLLGWMTARAVRRTRPDLAVTVRPSRAIRQAGGRRIGAEPGPTFWRMRALVCRPAAGRRHLHRDPPHSRGIADIISGRSKFRSYTVADRRMSQ